MNRLLTTMSCTLLVCACEAQTMRVWMKDGYDVETILENALKKDCVEAFAHLQRKPLNWVP